VLKLVESSKFEFQINLKKGILSHIEEVDISKYNYGTVVSKEFNIVIDSVFPVSSNQKLVRSQKFKGSGPNILATLKMNEEEDQKIPQKEIEKKTPKVLETVKETPKVLETVKETPVKLKKINSNENIKKEIVVVEPEDEEEEDWEEWNDKAIKIKNQISTPKVKESIPTKKVKKIGAEEEDDIEETKVVEEPNYFSQFEKEEPKKKEDPKIKQETRKVEEETKIKEENLNDEDIGSGWGSELLEDDQLVETAEVNSIKG
jgi:hypothetical protein